MTRDTWHVTCDMWHTWWRVNILSKFQLPSSYALGVMMFWRFGGKGSVTKVIVEQHRLHQVCLIPRTCAIRFIQCVRIVAPKPVKLTVTARATPTATATPRATAMPTATATDQLPNISSTMHSRLICQDRHFCLGELAYLLRPAKPP